MYIMTLTVLFLIQGYGQKINTLHMQQYSHVENQQKCRRILPFLILYIRIVKLSLNDLKTTNEAYFIILCFLNRPSMHGLIPTVHKKLRLYLSAKTDSTLIKLRVIILTPLFFQLIISALTTNHLILINTRTTGSHLFYYLLSLLLLFNN